MTSHVPPETAGLIHRSKTVIVPVPPEYVPVVWEDVSPLIDKALKRSNGELWLEDVYQFLIDGTCQLALAVVGEKTVAALVMEVIQYPRKTAIRLFLGGGSHLKEWGPELNEFMGNRAKEIGADLIEVQGRMGWVRYLKGLCGAKVRSVMMTRRV